MLAAYEVADATNLPKFRARLKEINYTPAQLAEFREKAGKPIWDKWVADNQAKTDAKGVMTAMLAEIDKALAKHVK